MCIGEIVDRFPVASSYDGGRSLSSCSIDISNQLNYELFGNERLCKHAIAAIESRLISFSNKNVLFSQHLKKLKCSPEIVISSKFYHFELSQMIQKWTNVALFVCLRVYCEHKIVCLHDKKRFFTILILTCVLRFLPSHMRKQL